MDLYILNEINKLKGGGTSSKSSSPGLYPQESPPQNSTAQTLVSYSGIQERYFHQTYDWQTDHPTYGGSFTHYGNDYINHESLWRVPLGQGFYRFHADGVDRGNNTKGVRTHYAKGQTCGAMHMQTMEGRSSDNYAPMCVNILFARNTTGQDLSRTVQFHYSNRWNNGYEGAAMHVYTPNSTTYAGATGSNGNWNTVWNTTSGGGNHSGAGASVTFPANKTIAIMTVSTLSYWTASSYWTHMRNTNYFSNINSWMDGSGDIVCDLKLSQTYRQARIPEFNQNYTNTETFHRFYNKCGQIFGER